MSVERDLSKFILEVWPKSCGDERTLVSWVKRAKMAFPDVNLLEETRKAAAWEAEKASNSKKSIRRFLTNWWGRSQASSVRSSPVVYLSAIRWLRKHNKRPDFMFENWARDKEVTSELVLEFSAYLGVAAPEDPDEVVAVFLRGA